MLSHPGEPAFPVTRKTHMFTQMWPEPLSKEAETWVFACDVIVPNVKSANQQISRPANQPISQSIRPANQHTSKSANQSDQQISQSANQPISQSANQPIKQTSKSADQQISRPENQPISQSIRQAHHPSEHLYNYAASKGNYWWVSTGSIQFLLKH